MKLVAFTLCVLTVACWAQPTGTNADGMPNDIIDMGPAPSREPDPPHGFYYWEWWKKFPGKESKLWHGLSRGKNPKRPKHKKQTDCEIDCATNFIDSNADQMRNDLTQQAHQTFSNDTVTDAVNAMRNSTSDDEEHWPKDVLDKDGYYSNGQIHIRVVSLQDMSASQTAWILAHEAMHDILAHSNGSSLQPFDPPSWKPDYPGETYADYFIYHFMDGKPVKCDCDK